MSAVKDPFGTPMYTGSPKAAPVTVTVKSWLAFEVKSKSSVPVPVKRPESAAVPTEVQVKSPLAAIVVAKVFEAQSVGLAARSVAVDELPDKAAVTVPAVKFPEASLATIALKVFELVAVVFPFGNVPVTAAAWFKATAPNTGSPPPLPINNT